MMPQLRDTRWTSPAARVGWRAMLGSALLAWAASGTSRGQSIWEASPYAIEVWVAFDPQVRLEKDGQNQLPAALESLAGSRVGAVWQVKARAVPPEYLGEVLRETELDFGSLREAQPSLMTADKLILLWVKSDGAGYRTSAREADLSTRRWSATEQALVTRSSDLAATAFRLVCDVFVPLVRIENINESQVTVAVRGGALERPEASPRRWHVPTQIQIGDALQPVLRMTDRNGRVGPDGVKLIEWTVLVVNGQHGSLLTCDVQSGFRQPFSTRRNSRIQQLAFVIKPRLDATTLRLVNRQSPNEPLVGYEIYRRREQERADAPREADQPDAGHGDDAAQWVGRTDWRGELAIARDPQNQVGVYFVRNGQQLLGKLPMVPGHEPLLIAPLRNDELRLEAEGFLLGVQESLVDLVARREVLASRIRRAIEANELERAEVLLRELRQLDTQADFARRVEQRKQSLSTVDAQVQKKIDELFAQTRSLLGKYLSPDQVDQLSRSLETARKSATE